MANITRQSAYSPSAVPEEPEKLLGYLREEHDKISLAVEKLESWDIEISHVAPPKPRAGMLRLADGTDWNPGGGAGLYGYYSNQWNKLAPEISGQGQLKLRVDTVAPTDLVEGTVAFADGTLWNPNGRGKGVYVWYSGVWNKLEPIPVVDRSVQFFTLTVSPPTGAVDGSIRLADGVGWNPTGEGGGFYGYYNSAWHKLGD